MSVKRSDGLRKLFRLAAPYHEAGPGIQEKLRDLILS
jgi:hypothetical protein